MVGKSNETHVYVNGKKCKSLIDSGSMVSTISEPTLRYLHPVPTVKTLDEFILSVRVAEGSQLPYHGYVEVNIKVPFHTESMMVPLLVVPETDYNRSVPVIIGTNVLRPIKSTLTCDSQVNIPREWETAFSAMDASITSLVKSTNRRPIKVSPMSIMTVTGLCKTKSGNQTAVTECLDDNQGSLGICPRVVSLKPTGKSRVPVRIFNMTAKAIYLKPRSVICGLNEVKIVRHADLDSSDENTESSKKGDEQDKGKILEKLGVELTELTPEMKASPSPFIETILLTQNVVTEDLHEVDISTIDWQEEQNADPSIRRVIALVQSGHKPTKRKISLEHEDVQSQPDPSIPVYILKPEHGRSRKVTVHRNMILPIFSLPTEEIVREQSQSRSKKDKSPTRPSLELQKDDNVKRDENDQTLNEVSVNRIRDENRNASLVLNPRAPEFLPTSFGSSLPVSSVSSDFSSSRPLSITQSGYSGEVFSDTSGQTRISQSELNPSSSSTFRGASGSDNSRENSDTREQTDAQPVLRHMVSYPHSYLFTSSRGKCFYGMACKDIYVKSGGRLQDLCRIAVSRLKGDMSGCIIYFVVGIPDICTLTRKKDQFNLYEESWLDLEVDHVSKMKDIISDTERRIKEFGGKVVFTTITTSSFRDWNSHRLRINKTKYLLYEEEYPKMQEKLHEILREINKFITELNCRNNMITPFLHTYVHKKKGDKIKYIFSKLVDGVHPSEDLGCKWFQYMERIILENETKLAGTTVK
ncbi:unnamed protein product [Mytilus edulis]|uniref:Uncharacterized protein n=1 Tax=Mytilus edulis TaxID=6550 RepID=A0A8S3QLG1_MYTED|nr:unnamed protein product [Mytilus edulis]